MVAPTSVRLAVTAQLLARRPGSTPAEVEEAVARAEREWVATSLLPVPDVESAPEGATDTPVPLAHLPLPPTVQVVAPDPILPVPVIRPVEVPVEPVGGPAIASGVH